jgi:hypothetical protein
MTDWHAMTEADFNAARAPKAALAAAESGQDALFPGTPTLPAKPARVRPELDGQGGLFGDPDPDAEPDWCCDPAETITSWLEANAPAMTDAEIDALPRPVQGEARTIRNH